MRLDTEIGRWYEVADDPSRAWEDKLAAYQELVDDYYEADRFSEFCDRHLAHAEECMAEYIDSDQFDAHLVATIRGAFPPHEHEQFIHGAWSGGHALRGGCGRCCGPTAMRSSHRR